MLHISSLPPASALTALVDLFHGAGLEFRAAFLVLSAAGRPTGEAYVQLLAAKHERRLLGKQPVGAHSGLQLGMRRAPTASVTRSSAAQLRAEPRELIRVERTARLSGACAAGRALSRAVGLPLV